MHVVLGVVLSPRILKDNMLGVAEESLGRFRLDDNNTGRLSPSIISQQFKCIKYCILHICIILVFSYYIILHIT